MIAAVVIGIAFGFALERAGLGNARKLAGQFYGTDFTVFKVMFSAILVAMLGAFWLGRLGILDLRGVYVPETFLAPQLIGGLLFGAGFVIAGLCPGTSCVAAATGRGDGLAVVLGIGTGVRAAAGFLREHQPRIVDAAGGAGRSVRRGGLRGRADGAARISRGTLVGVARMTHRALALAALLLGALAPFAGSPYRERRGAMDVRQLAAQVAREEDHVTALELAAWIKDRKPGLRIIDVRAEQDFEEYHLPRAEWIPLETLLSTPFAKDETVVLVSDGGAHAAQAWVFLRALGHERVYFLRGGLGEWLDDVMNPPKTTELSRYFGGTARGDNTADDVAKMRRRGC
jgi:uncharacterized protein